MQSSGPNYGSYALNLTVVRFSSRTRTESRSYFPLSCSNCFTDRQRSCATITTYSVCVSFFCNTETSCSGLFESHLTLRQLPFLITIRLNNCTQNSSHGERSLCCLALVISTFPLLLSWVLRLSFQLLLPHLGMIERADEFDLET